MLGFIPYYWWKNFLVFVKVVIDFEVEIQERWTPELNDSTSDEFKNLANIYVTHFNEKFLQDETNQVGDSSISFGKVRILRFILEDTSLFDDPSFRYVIFHQFDWSSGAVTSVTDLKYHNDITGITDWSLILKCR